MVMKQGLGFATRAWNSASRSMGSLGRKGKDPRNTYDAAVREASGGELSEAGQTADEFLRRRGNRRGMIAGGVAGAMVVGRSSGGSGSPPVHSSGGMGMPPPHSSGGMM